MLVEFSLWAKGRMLPEDVADHASWVDSSGRRCFQVMEAPHEDSLRPRMAAWGDLVEFEVVPVVTSAEFLSIRSRPLALEAA
jgi:hypothetical protein